MCINQYKQHFFLLFAGPSYSTWIRCYGTVSHAMKLLPMPRDARGLLVGHVCRVGRMHMTWHSLQSLDDTLTFNSNLLSLTSKGAVHQTHLKPVPSKQWSTITLHILQGMFTNVCTIPHLHIQFTKNSDVLWHIGLQQYGTLHHRYWGNTVSFTFLEIRLTVRDCWFTSKAIRKEWGHISFQLPDYFCLWVNG